MINIYTMNYDMRTVEFKDTLPLIELLHPGREHKKYAKMSYKKDAKWTLSDDEVKVTFFGVYIGFKLCGTLSVYLTPNNLYRVRSFYVLSEYRRKGFGKLLLDQTIQTAKDLGGDGVWGYPNEAVLPLYIRAGFTKESEFEQADWGVNCYVFREL